MDLNLRTLGNELKFLRRYGSVKYSLSNGNMAFLDNFSLDDSLDYANANLLTY